jgi:hypothetical protein
LAVYSTQCNPLSFFIPPECRDARAIRTKAYLEFFAMLISLTRIVAVGLTHAIAACATAPAVDLTPPPRKAYDAKTQLESGRRM